MKRLISAVALTLLGVAVLPAARSGASGYPSTPTGVHVTATTHTSFTVGLNQSTNATAYRLYVSRTKSDVYVSNIKTGNTTAGLHVFSSSTPSIKAGGLTYTTNPFYFRVVSVNGANRAFDPDFHSVGLRPATPTSLHVVDRYLLWASGPATGFTIQRATNSSMTQGVVTASIRGQAHQFTPYGLTSGSTYYFRVRALSQSTSSLWTAVVSMAVTTHEQSTLVMTYNLLQSESDGTTEAGNVIANWLPGRRDAAAALIESIDPDVVGINEGRDWIGDPANHLRQVDSLNNAITGGNIYNVAHTEPLWNEPLTVRTGDYILYKPSVFAAYSAGGHWNIDKIGIANNRWAVYQPLQSVATGAKFLFVSTHFIVGAGSTLDQRREDEANKLLSLATAQSNALGGIPIVYAGDFNSNPIAKQHPLDGPGVVMRQAHVADARDVAPVRRNEKYDSVNEYSRTPLPYSIFIDYIWAPPGISVSLWGTALNLSGGQFVGVIPSDHDPVYARIRYSY
jgi:endonuclease/exonuclease/phosphatase family metal-dependent hydrolase